jgi:hypothetical protein
MNEGNAVDERQRSEDTANLNILIDDLVTADGFASVKNPFGTVAPSRAEIEKELDILDENDKTLKWEELQKRKMKNDEKIAGMVTNVHQLLNEYGLDGKPTKARKPRDN